MTTKGTRGVQVGGVAVIGRRALALTGGGGREGSMQNALVGESAGWRIRSLCDPEQLLSV